MSGRCGCRRGISGDARARARTLSFCPGSFCPGTGPYGCPLTNNPQTTRNQFRNAGGRTHTIPVHVPTIHPEPWCQMTVTSTQFYYQCSTEERDAGLTRTSPAPLLTGQSLATCASNEMRDEAEPSDPVPCDPEVVAKAIGILIRGRMWASLSQFLRSGQVTYACALGGMHRTVVDHAVEALAVVRKAADDQHMSLVDERATMEAAEIAEAVDAFFSPGREDRECDPRCFGRPAAAV